MVGELDILKASRAILLGGLKSKNQEMLGGLQLTQPITMYLTSLTAKINDLMTSEFVFLISKASFQGSNN